VSKKPAAIEMADRWHVPASQKPEAQSPSALQDVLQALDEQMKSAAQGCAAGATHEPALQLLCPTMLIPEQVGPLPQAAVGNEQAPPDPQAPAQVPVPPQEGWLLCGAVLAARLVHVPWNPGRSQATQAPEQAVLQQYPSGEQVVPEMHKPGTVLQSCPCLLLQAPVESQVPAQRPLGSSSFVAATQACAVLHVMHVPVQSLLAQQAEVAIHVVLPPAVQDFVPEGQL
jgi:hypothetical protein